MSYSEADGKVVLTMTRSDYEFMLLALGFATVRIAEREEWVAFMNRLNEGNPNYVAYAVDKEMTK